MDKIRLNKENEVFKQYITEESNVLKDISKINIFVGANNSGKSRFLREIFKILTKTFHFVTNEFQNKEFRKSVEIPFEIPVKELINKIKDEKRLEGKVPFAKEILTSFYNNNYYLSFEELQKQLVKNVNLLFKDEKKQKSNNLIKDISTELSNYLFKSYLNQIILNYQITYIPILRSLRQTNNSNNSLKERTIKDYFKNFISYYEKKSIIQNNKKIDIFTGEELYKDIKKLLLSYFSNRQIIIQFENLLSIYFFNGMNVSMLPRELDDDGTINNDLFIKLGNEKEFPIYELGDGIQTIILYVFPLFLHKDKKHFLFIEEPEQNLHPGMQRILLEILNDKMFKNVTVFFTTHSNHLLDTTIKTSKQTSIFSFKKESIDDEKGNEQIPTFKIENLKSSSTDILNDLGVKNSSVFLANCTIWVEGITDRKYIKQFLKIYFYKKDINYFQEDLHYSFVEYAGSNIAHWDFDEDIESDNIFAGSISNRIFLIADSDIKKIDEDNIEIDNERYFEIDGKKFEVNKWKRHKYLKDSLKDKFYRLDSKEIENLLTPEVILGTILLKEKNKDLKFKEKEISNNKFIGINGYEVERPTYWWQNVGEFIDNSVIGKKKTYTKDNSIKNKSTFCDKAVDYMESQKDNWNKDYDKLLSKETQELCEKIYEFIKSNNKNL